MCVLFIKEELLFLCNTASRSLSYKCSQCEDGTHTHSSNHTFDHTASKYTEEEKGVSFSVNWGLCQGEMLQEAFE